MSFVSTPLNVYLVEELDAEPKMQTTMGILQTLPWSLKLIFGFLSDAVPILGMHRKPYLAIGALVYSSAFLMYAMSGSRNVGVLAGCMFMGTLGLITMDVMCDTMVCIAAISSFILTVYFYLQFNIFFSVQCVERSRFEPDAIKGQMQATYYTVRFAGGILGSFGGALLYNKASWGWGLTFQQICFISGMIPVVLVAPALCWYVRMNKVYSYKLKLMLIIRRLVEKYKRHRLADGRRFVVPFNYDTSALSTYKSVGEKLSSLANEETPLLLNQSSSERRSVKSGVNIIHPTTEVSVPYHAHAAAHQSNSVSFSPASSRPGKGREQRRQDEEKIRLIKKKGASNASDGDSDGSDDIEVGLQLQLTLRPPPGNA